MHFFEAAVLPGSALLCVTLVFGQTAIPASTTPDPTAIVSSPQVTYCFAHVRNLGPGLQPQPYIALQLHLIVSYRTTAARALILPLEHHLTVYTGFQAGTLSEFNEGFGSLGSPLPAMKELPSGVNPDNPVSPKNQVFTLIPAGGEMAAPFAEVITLPVNRQGAIRKYPDLRGHTVYLQLHVTHRKLDKTLEAKLAGRWAPIGAIWTGTLTTNPVAIDVPAAPQATGSCVDVYTPAHPVGNPDTK